MVDKNLNTRIKQKYDALENWESNNPVLLKGEIALVEVSSNNNLVHNAPTVLMKVGDGESTFTELEWVSGLATDVYPWAKQASKPSYTTNELSLPLVVANEPDLVAQGIIPNTGANRFAFLPSDQIILEQSKDAGQTWEAYPNLSDTIKGRLFLGTDTSSVINIPTKDGVKSCDCMVRISITGQKFKCPEGTPETDKFNYWNKDYILSSERYFNPNLYSIYLNSTSDSIQLTLEMYDGYGQLKSTQVYDKLQGYSGRNNLRGTASTFGGGISQLSNNWTYRFIFRTQCNDGSFDDSNLNQGNLTSTQAIYGIQSFSNSCYLSSNSMMRSNHIYDYDYLQNTSFPGNIIPTTSESNYLGTSSNLWAGIFAKWGHFSNYVSENGTPLQDRYISFTLDSNNYPALCSRGTSSLTPYQYIRTGTVGILPYTLTDSGGEWTNADCRIGSSAYRFSESYISSMYCNKAQASTSLSAPQLIEDGAPLEDKYVNFESKLLTTNPFGGKNDLYISKIDNAFYCADKRWNVSASLYNESDDSLIEEINSSEISRLFNGNYENYIDISQGQYAVITVNFDTDEGQLSSGVKCFPGYPYGYFYFSFYSNGAPLSTDGVQVQVYCNFESHGVGWHDLVGYYINGTSGSSQNVIIGYLNSYYSISEVKFTIHGRADSIQILLSQIEMSLSRPSPYRQPIISKYTAEKLYYPLTAPQFLADSFIENNVKLSNKYVQLDTVGDRVGFKQSNGNLPTYIICGSSGMIPRTTANTWDTAVCYLGTSSYRFGEAWVKQIYSKSMIADVYVKAPTLYEGALTLSNKYVQLDYSDGNAVAFFNPKGQSPTYIKAGLNGIVPYTSADNWESSSGYVGAHGARFATSYIKDMYANVISADNQISAVRFIENGTNLSNKYALKSELPSTKQILTAYTGSENIGFASTANTKTTKVITLNTTLQENDIVRVYVSGTGAYASQNAGVITFEVAKGADNTKLMGSGSTFTATGGTSGIIFANVNVTPNQLVCGTYALTDSAYAPASVCDVFKVTIERNTN